MIELLLQAESALSLGLLDRAEALYQQVIGADPRNSIAVVGLARVALERSDEVGALTFARRALTIDRENNAAQRMVQRLEEVLRTRGVSVGPDAGLGAGLGASAEPDATVHEATDRADPTRAATEHGGHSSLDRLLRRGRDRR
ncbi:MAG: tetratricopeptide repeat protein [Candidatus Limnocylindrales bacterium]